MSRLFSRRTLLRGAGVALALPWMESLAPKEVRAQATTVPKRFLPIFFPNGTAEFFNPGATGQGTAWGLSPILAPFLPLKGKMIVLTNMENYSSFQADNPDVEPSHGRDPGAFLCCVDSRKTKSDMGLTGDQEANGISADQVIAQSDQYKAVTPLQSLQVGLSTIESYCDGMPCSLSRSISWKSATEPMYKEVDPGALFDRIVSSGAGSTGDSNTPDPAAAKRRALNQSVLDAVTDSATSTNTRLGAADKIKMQQFLDSVSSVEQRIDQLSGSVASTLMCSPITRPTLTAQYGLANGQDGYDKTLHADLINDLIVMAFQCDATRVISYMLDDERSEFVYDHVPELQFANGGVGAPTGNKCGNYHGLQHAGDTNNGFATIGWWLSSKVSELCQKLDAIEDSAGVSILDNTIAMYASSMHGGNHHANQLPVALIGGGGGTLKLDQHVAFGDTPGDRPMRDLYFTIMNQFFQMGVTNFGVNTKGVANALITEILA